MVLAHSILKYTPLPIAILDRDLQITATSDLWNREFPIDYPLGESFKSSYPNLPEEIFLDIDYCLDGVEQRSDEAKFIDHKGQSLYYKWDINSWLNEEKQVEGIILVLQNYTKERRKRMLLEKSQEVARIGHWELDLRTNSLFWSRMTKQIHEVPEDYVPDLESGINFYKEGKSRKNIQACVNRAITEGIPWDTEFEIVTHSGNEIWVRAKGEAESVDGVCIRIFGTFQDIDQRKRAELLSEQSSNRLVQATNAAGIGIWEYHFREKKVVWDTNMHSLYSIPQNEKTNLIAAWHQKVTPTDRNNSFEELESAIANDSEFNTQFPVIWPNGEKRWLRSQARIIKDKAGKPLKMIGACWDFTELKNTQLQLLNIENSLHGAFANSKVGMALVSREGQFLEVNESFSLSMGYSSEALYKMTFQQITHPEDLEIDLILLREVLDGKRETYQIEKRFFHKSGKIVNTFLTVTAVKDINGNLTHFISQYVDITPRIEAENKLKRVLNLTSKQNDRLLNFAHIVSHNLRSHSTNLSMITELLLADKISAEEQRNTLTMLQSAANGLQETIQHLNEVVQVQITSTDDLKKLDLEEIFEKVLGDIDALIQQNNAKINLSLEPNLKILGIPAYCESVFLNLLTNSLKYRSPERPCEIDIVAVNKKNKVELTVGDNGMGIDLEKYGEKLFGMYKTFHRNKDAKGIGLFITRNQIEAMGGSIRVKSHVDQGSEFLLEFIAAK